MTNLNTINNNTINNSNWISRANAMGIETEEFLDMIEGLSVNEVEAELTRLAIDFMAMNWAERAAKLGYDIEEWEEMVKDCGGDVCKVEAMLVELEQ